MKIVQINAVYEYSSTGRTTKELHLYLLEQGVQSEVYYAAPNIGSVANELIGNKLDHKIHAFLSRLFGKQAFFSTMPTNKLIKQLRASAPDVVILRNVHSNYINLPILLNYLAKEDIATVVVLHDCWFYTGNCCHYTEAGCYKWKYECNNCPLIFKQKDSYFFDTTQSVFHIKKKLFESIPRLAVVGVSDWITNEAKISPILEHACIIKRIYNWIDRSVFYPRTNEKEIREKYGISETDFVALGVSMKWNYKKGEGMFVELAKRVPDIKVLMVGELSIDSLPFNVINIPPTSSVQELAGLYSMVDVLLNFSIQESFGKVAAEALACGTPLIVNNATANTEIPGECGYIVNNSDLEGVVKAVLEIRNKGKLYYQKKCVERARELFDIDKNIAQYMNLFSELQMLRNQ